MKKPRSTRSMCRLRVITAVAATTAALTQRAALAQNTPAIFQNGGTDTNLLNSANYSTSAIPNASTDLEFVSGYPSAANFSAGMTGSLSVGSINDLNTSFSVTMANNTSTGNTLTLGGTGNQGNTVSPVSSADLLYVPLGATLNIAANTSTGLTALALGSGNLDINGTASIQGIISGTNGLTKTGTGLLQLYQADTYTGNSIVNANISSGTVQLGTGTALGSATGDVTLIGAATLYCYDNLIPSYASSFSSGRSFNISSPTSTIKVGGTQAWSISGPIVGTGVLNVVAGTGSLTDAYSTSSAQKYGNGPGILSTNISSGTYILSYLLDLPQGICAINNGATFEEANTGGQYSANTTFYLAGGNDTIYIANTNAQIKFFGTVSGPGSLIKTGVSTLVLENSNTYTGTTNLSGGSTLSLDYTATLSSSALNMGGSTAGATFNTLSSASGLFNASITSIANTNLIGGGNNINIGNFNSSTQSISLGAIGRVGATSTLNVALPTVGSVTTTSVASNFSGGQQTIIGGFVTVNGNSWAANNAGTLSGLATYNTSFGAGSDVDVIASAAPVVSTINSLRFNTATSTNITLTGPLTIATGGILESANVAGSTSNITGGSLTSGNGTDLIISQFNTTTPLTIGSSINDSTGSIAVTKTGPGTMVLSGSNAYSGGTFINAGAVGITSDASLGAVPATAATNITLTSATSALQAAAPVTLSATRTILLGALGGTIDENSNPITITGAISGGGSLSIINSTGGTGGIFNLAPTGTIASGTTVILGSANTGGSNFNVSGSRGTTVSLTGISIAAGGDGISAGNFNTSSFNLSLGAITRTTGATVNFTLPTTGNITTTTANQNTAGGQQTILGGYATVGGVTWAVSGTKGTAGIISGLPASGYDTAFTTSADEDITAASAPLAGNGNLLNSLRFNTPAPFTLVLAGYNSFTGLTGLQIATGGILETANVGANAEVISGSTLATLNADTIVTQNNTAAPLTISSAITNGSSGSQGLTKAGPGMLILSGTNLYTGTTNVSGGTLQWASATAFPGGNLSIGFAGTAMAANSGTGTYAVSINSFANAGVLDVVNNAAVIHTGTTITALSTQAARGFNKGLWNGGSGSIVSSAAAADTNRLTAVGIIVNDVSGTPLYGASGSINSTFEGVTPLDGDLLVKYTYYGDTNLDGKVDGTDYSRIDASFLAEQTGGNVTGWYNGDFNYDGVVNGSDYTLIDNAFNMQGAVLASSIANPLAVTTAEVAPAFVPEPATLGLIGLGAVGLLGRRRRR